MIRSSIQRLTSALAAGFLGCAPVWADTLVGTNFSVVYDGTKMGLFGNPAISGNSITFSPTAFSVQSLNGAGDFFRNQTINLDIIPKAGFTVSGTNVVERGAYLIQGANSFVDAQGELRAITVAAPQQVLTSNLQTQAPLSVIGTSTNWMAGASLSFATLAQPDNRGYRITLTNFIEAYSDPADVGGSAFIEKRFGSQAVRIDVISPVPEPEQWALFGFGLALIAMRARAKSTRRGELS